MPKFLFLVAALSLTCSASHAALSSNLIPNGDFESADSLKTADSPLTQAEIDAGQNPLRGWQFHPDFDMGRFVPAFGASEQDDPRTAYAGGGEVGSINRSNLGGNHVLEGLAFRPWTTVIVPAPTNMVAGQVKLDFDFFFDYWDEVDLEGTPQILHPVVHGFSASELPAWQDRWSPHNNDDWFYGNGTGPNGPETITLNWDLLNVGANFNSQQEEHDNNGEPEIPYHPAPNDGLWHSYSDGWTVTPPAGYVPEAYEQEDGSYMFDGTFDVDQAYDYLAVTFRMVTYAETHPYFFIFGGKPTDTFAMAIDNVSLQVTIQLPGDFDGSGTVDTQDINPFILALTDWAGYMAAYPDVDPVAVDPNGSGVVNTEDINPFIALLTGGGQASIIPEPASLSLLALGAMVLGRRRQP